MYKGVAQLENTVLRDYLLLVIFTGLRRSEAAELNKWQNIDLKAKTLTILDTQNHQSYILPLSSFLDIL